MSPEAQQAYIQGLRSGVSLASKLGALYDGQDGIEFKIRDAGNGMVDVMERTLAGEYDG